MSKEPNLARPTESIIVGALWPVEESRQVRADHVMQAAVLFEHGRPIAPRDFVHVHRKLDYCPIQGTKHAEEFVDIGGSDALGTHFSP